MGRTWTHAPTSMGWAYCFIGTTPFDKERLKEASYEELCRILREEEPAKPSTRISTLGQAATTVSANRESEPRRLSQLLRRELDWIVIKALEKDRNRRYETANGLARDIERYLHDEPVQACPPSAWYRLRKLARRNKGILAIATGTLVAVIVMAASIGWGVGDRAARRASVANRVRDSVNAARTLIAENKLAGARQKLAEARALLSDDRAVFADLATEVEAAEAELDRFQQFVDLIERAHEAETAPILETALAGDGFQGSVRTLPSASTRDRQLAAAATLRVQALERYGILEGDDWNTNLEGSVLGSDQIKQIRRSVYQELLWLAEDVFHRRQEHRSAGQLLPQPAARQALIYLGKAVSAHRATQALYALRARCRKALGEEAASKADRQLAEKNGPTIALDHYLRGQAAYDAKKLAAAIQAFEAALHLDPTHYWSLMWLGYCLVNLGRGPEDFAGAARVFTGCILKRRDHAHAYGGRAVAYGKLRRYEEALADCSKAIELDPKLAEAWSNRGLIYRKLGQLDKALADYSKAIDLDPKRATAWSNRGAIYCDHLAQYHKAIAHFSKAIELDPKRASAWYNRGVAYRKMGQLEKAVADWSKAIELDPKDAGAWANRGAAYFELRQWHKAVAHCSKAIELDPKDAKAWSNRGAAYAELRQWHKALVDFSKAIELDPKDADVWNNRGTAYSKLGQWDKTIADCSKAIELDPKDAKAWYNRGVAYGILRQPDKAIADLSKAIELAPTLAEAWGDRGAAYSKLGQPDKAIADCSKAIALDPTRAQIWTNRGVAYHKLGQLDKAVADLSKSIELDPKQTLVWWYRGAIYCDQLAQYAKAVADFSRAIELEPKLADVWYCRGNAYRKLGQQDKAVADYSKAIELEPKLAGAWCNRGLAYSGLGQWDKAIFDLSKFIEVAPNHPMNATATNYLAWLLATCPEPRVRNPGRAVELAGKAVAAAPKERGYWKTLGVAHYRAGDWKAAVAALHKSVKLRQGGDAVDDLFLAMAHWQLGNREQARRAYEQAVQWLEKNKETLEKHKAQAEELRRFRSEAEEVLELKKK